MNTQDFKRKLTAVFSADVAGYSRLMGEDEAATVKTLEAYKQVMFSLIKQHRGRVVDSPGDNILAEFASVVDAVQCGVAVQKELQTRNADLPESRRMQFRIGINLGDVIEEGERIYGDGVNIAARLEALADPGGICVSKTAFDQIETKLPLGYEYLGDQTVKNIAKPVGAYRVVMEPRVVVAGAKEKKPSALLWPRKGALTGAVALLILLIGVAVWNFYWRAPKIEPASKEKMAFPLPDKPSIAVLPFSNMSGDPEQEYFSDGMTEDLITDLSKISGLFVIARNSTFVYKGKPVKIRQVAEELGVRYVLEGSVRRAGDQVRINAQLVDSTTGQHLWAERYDGTMRDVFSLQDKINQKITTALAVKLSPEQKAAVSDKGTNNPAAYDELVKGREYYLRSTAGDYAKAETCFKRAIELDPNYVQARAALAGLYFWASNVGLLGGLNISHFEAKGRARQYLREALKKPTSIAYQVASYMDLNLRQWDAAISQLEKALALDPNDPACHIAMSWVLSMSGRPAEAMEHAKSAMRLDPNNTDRYWPMLAIAYFCMGKWEEAATLAEKALKLNPEVLYPAAVLASAYAHLGRIEESGPAFETWRKSFGYPISVEWVQYWWPFKDRQVAESFWEGLIKAALPGQLSGYVHVSKEDQLTGEDLRAVAFAPAWTGAEWSQESTKDGKVTLHGAFLTGGVDTGRAWLEGDKLWMQWQKWYDGMACCGTIFKNPRGTPSGKDEYIGFNDNNSYRFSLVR